MGAVPFSDRGVNAPVSSEYTNVPALGPLNAASDLPSGDQEKTSTATPVAVRRGRIWRRCSLHGLPTSKTTPRLPSAPCSLNTIRVPSGDHTLYEDTPSASSVSGRKPLPSGRIDQI